MDSSAARTICARPCAAREADDGPAAVHVPVRRTQARKCGHEIDVAVVGNGGGHRFGFRGRSDQAHFVAQPFDHRAGHEHAALQGVTRLAVDLPGNGGNEVADGLDRVRPGVHQQKTAGAIGVFSTCPAQSSHGRTGQTADRPPAPPRGSLARERAYRACPPRRKYPPPREASAREYPWRAKACRPICARGCCKAWCARRWSRPSHADGRRIDGWPETYPPFQSTIRPARRVRARWGWYPATTAAWCRKNRRRGSAPVRSRSILPRPSRLRRSISGAVRRHCQTMAL